MVPAAALLALPRLYFQSPALLLAVAPDAPRGLGEHRAAGAAPADAVPGGEAEPHRRHRDGRRCRGTPRTGRPRSPGRDGIVAVLAAGLVAAVVVRLVLLPTEGMRGDLDLFAGWTHRLATDVPLGHAYDLELTLRARSWRTCSG